MKKHISLIGCGVIGRGWAILFANAGYNVRIYDPDKDAIDTAIDAIKDILNLEPDQYNSEEILSSLHPMTSLVDAVDGAFYVQENVPEILDIKRQVLKELSTITKDDVILASSCSTIPPDDFMSNIRGKERCIIAHPFSPPHLIPLVEIVKTSWTNNATAQITHELMLEIGQTPILINRPIVGFAANRLQAAVINEALSLVEKGVVSPQDVDLCMSQGLGMRWAFMGPFETMELNSPDGFKSYVEKFEHVYRNMLDDMDTTSPWHRETIDRIENWRRSEYPNKEDIYQRRLWRDNNLQKIVTALGRT